MPNLRLVSQCSVLIVGLSLCGLAKAMTMYLGDPEASVSSSGFGPQAVPLCAGSEFWWWVWGVCLSEQCLRGVKKAMTQASPNWRRHARRLYLTRRATKPAPR